VLDETVGYRQPIILWNDLHQVLLDFHGIEMFGPAQPLAEPGDVGIHRDSLRNSINLTQNHIGGLAAHPGDLYQLFHGLGNLPPVISHQGLGASDQILRLISIKASRVDDLFHLFGFGKGEFLRCGIGLKKFRGDQIDPFISALGGKDDRT
jgi:hypothetical protein